MLNFAFEIVGVRAEPHAAVPLLKFRLRITESSNSPIHSILLRAQVQIQPRRRRHTPSEQERLVELFASPERWSTTVRPLLWTHITALVPAFEGTTAIDLPVACTYDFEVVAAKYLQALDEGEIPLLFLFSGTVFAKAENGFRVEQVPWEKEAATRLPLTVWRDLMDAYFPGYSWLRLRRESLDALQRFKAERALLTWDDVVGALLNSVLEPVK